MGWKVCLPTILTHDKPSRIVGGSNSRTQVIRFNWVPYRYLKFCERLRTLPEFICPAEIQPEATQPRSLPDCNSASSSVCTPGPDKYALPVLSPLTRNNKFFTNQSEPIKFSCPGPVCKSIKSPWPDVRIIMSP